MRLGLDTYSLRWQGWDAFQLLDYAARLGLENVQFSERAALASLDHDYLRSLKRSADQRGLSIELGMLSFDQFSSLFRPEYGPGEQQLTDLIRAAPVVGSSSIRCVLGGQAERLGPIPFEQHVDEFLRVLRAAAPVARDVGIKVALENHGGVDFLARELRALIELAGTDVLGACLDTGNSAYAGEDPVVSTEVLAPYVLTTQIRDTRVWGVPGGAMAQWVPLGQGSTNLPRVRDLLREHAPNVAFNLEIITGYAPRQIPYADPDSDFWRTYPNMLARDFARFLSLTQAGPAEPFAQVILPQGIGAPLAGPEGDRLRDQQRRHFEHSVRYAREELGLTPETELGLRPGTA